MEKLIRLTKQELCSKCDICCRFPEEKPNLKPTGFDLKKHKEMFICEAFDLKTGKCLKYSKRPLDCRIYPFATAKSIDKENIMLVLDELCPAAKEFNKNKLILNTKIIDGSLCVFARDTDNTFMPVPPLSAKNVKPAVFERCFELMDIQNKGRTESRIENIPKDTAEELEKEGFRITKKDEEYIYKRKDLEMLCGDKYKHIRWLINTFKKENDYTFVNYSAKHLNGCADLLFKWLEEKKKKSATDNEQFLLKNIDKAHKRALLGHESLGLEGRVLLVKNKVAAYTFGTPLGKETFCVMFEDGGRVLKI